MKYRAICVILVLCLLAALAVPAGAAFEPVVVTKTSTDMVHTVKSAGRYSNWAGVSTVSQFSDEAGNFCFAVDQNSKVTVCRTAYGQIVEKTEIFHDYDRFGAAVCDRNGYLWLVFGNEGSDDVNEKTMFVCKYDWNGNCLGVVGGNGRESVPNYYGDKYNTRIPFDAGNCDAVVDSNFLVVNYAREMYSGHQSNAVLTMNLTDMKLIAGGIVFYNSHSFDQRVTVSNDGFLLASQGDCYPRTFTTMAKSLYGASNEMDTFHFWVEEGTLDRYNMGQLNKTYARLGNVLETPHGAALVGSSARSLSEAAKNEPFDVFVQVFDPWGRADDPASYVTKGQRSGLGGPNGDTPVTDYGVQWITDLAGTGKTADVVQAISLSGGRIAVLYELYTKRGSSTVYDSTWYTLLDTDGTVRLDPVELEGVRLNVDEDPVYSDGVVQWVANSGSGLVVYHLFPTQLPDAREELEQWRQQMFRLSDGSMKQEGSDLVVKAVAHTDGVTDTTVYCAFYEENGKMRYLREHTIRGKETQTVEFTADGGKIAEVRVFMVAEGRAMCEKIVLRNSE